MVVIGITDLHGDAACVQRAAKAFQAADVLLVAGDLTTFGDRRDAAAILEPLRACCAQVLAVPGNCDGAAVREYLTEEGVNVHGACRVIDGVAFVGLGGSLPCPNRTPTEYDEAQLASLLDQASHGVPAGLPTVLMSHQPPRDTAVDVASSGAHVGSAAVRTFIEAARPLACLSGHIHEACGLDTLGATRLINPGPLRQGGYAYIAVSDHVEAIEIRRL